MGSAPRPRRALITGVRGFLGRHVERLARSRGLSLHGVDVSGPAPVDLRERAAVEDAVRSSAPEVVFHLAGLLRSDALDTLYEVNALGTLHLLESVAALAPAATVVVVSSSAVYGTAQVGLLDEASPLRPLGHYGASKVAQETIALRYHTASGMRVIVARPFNLVGPGQPETLAAGAFAAQVVRAERAGRGELRCGDLSGTRDFVDVRDVAAALFALAETGHAGAVYNVCTGRGVPMQHCVDELVRRSRVPMSVRSTPTSSAGPDAQVGSPDRIARDTGWRAEIPFESSMEALLGSCRALNEESVP